jgi:hypothetical protein
MDRTGVFEVPQYCVVLWCSSSSTEAYIRFDGNHVRVCACSVAGL